MVTKTFSIGLFGMETFMVTVEADISRSLPAFEVVGLPDVSVKESRDRVRSAIKNSGLRFPEQKITVNLAPGDKRKEGPIYDLPILVSILLASGQLQHIPEKSIFLGELSLNGEIRPVRGILPMAIEARKIGANNLFIPAGNAAEAAVIENLNVFPVKNIKELYMHLTGEKHIETAIPKIIKPNTESLPDFADVRGQQEAKRALEIAAAGGHNILLIGSPGSGKSMLAKRLPSILPDLTFEEQIEVTKIYSIAGILNENTPLITSRPFRSPHHTISPAGLSGGGTIPRPGELSLAHNGVLFLDELPEFNKSALEVLRQPLEDGSVRISRVSGTIQYPCSVMFVAAMNPCPCGYFGHPTHPCICSKHAVEKYLNRVSGPLLDRLDLHIEVPPVDFDSLSDTKKSESSKSIKARVNAARKIQTARFNGTSIHCNSQITPDILHEICAMDTEATKIIKMSFEKLGLSARAYDRVLKVARTIADLDNSKIIHSNHIAEAVQYRSLDRKYWSKEL